MIQDTTQPQPSAATDAELAHAVACTIKASVGLCMDPPIAWSMTPLQMAVFKQLCFLQMGETGAHSLLPNVMEVFLSLARRPWWDVGVADLADEQA